jgi:arsenite-transporting ATPase
VGKTTCAAAAAIGAAARGRRVLLVSTDPAHSLRDVLRAVPARLAPAARGARRPGHASTARRGGSLHAVELDADRALGRWIHARRRHLRTVLARGTYLDDDDIDGFLRLSFPGVDELIGLLELTRVARARPYDEVVVDTAPTGHTLRLLAMPATLGRIAAVLDGVSAKHRFLAESLGGEAPRDAADAVVDEIARESAALGEWLRDPARCAFTWVLLPEALALAEARDAVAALDAQGIAVTEIVVNRVTVPTAGRCALCHARAGAERQVLAATRAAFPGRPLRLLPDEGTEPRGVPALRRLARRLAGPPPPLRDAPRPRALAATRAATAGGGGRRWLAQVAPPGLRLAIFAGKGGVGKTSCAAAAALALAARGPGDVLLLSTDPAHSLADVLDGGAAAGPSRSGASLADATTVEAAPRRLRVLELDAPRAYGARRERYREAVDTLFAALTGGSRFDIAFDRAVVQDLIDLAPPGLDEVFGVLTVVEALFPEPGRPRYETVVLDTAPTGHALRLLALPGAALEWVHALLSILLKYRRVFGLGELGVDLLAIARDLRRLQALLADPARTRVVAVTRPAELPWMETRRLLDGAARLGLPLGPVIVNDVTPPGCARCRRAADAEARVLTALRRERRSPGRRPCAIIDAPAIAPPPRGPAALARWAEAWECDS